MTDFLPPIDEDGPELVPAEPRGNGQGQPVATMTQVGDLVSVRRAARMMPRELARIRVEIAELAELFGDEWEYSFAAKRKNQETGKYETVFIEGPTIGCTMSVARAYGNCDIAHTKTQDEGNAWILYSTFFDQQTGFSLTRGFRQRKGQSRMGTDRGRGEDMDFQIGVSKSTRNVVARALDEYVRYARRCARSRLTRSINERRAEYLDRIEEYLGEIGYPLTKIEGAVGAKLAKWSDQQVAAVVRVLTAHRDGVLRDLDDVYDPKGEKPAVDVQPEESRSEPAGDGAADGGSTARADSSSPSGEPAAAQDRPRRGRPPGSKNRAKQEAQDAPELSPKDADLEPEAEPAEEGADPPVTVDEEVGVVGAEPAPSAPEQERGQPEEPAQDAEPRYEIRHPLDGISRGAFTAADYIDQARALADLAMSFDQLNRHWTVCTTVLARITQARPDLAEKAKEAADYLKQKRQKALDRLPR